MMPVVAKRRQPREKLKGENQWVVRRTREIEAYINRQTDPALLFVAS